MKIICSGMFANTTVGHIDNLMAYILGLQDLGHEVYVFEDIESKRCFDETGKSVAFQEWSGKAHFEQVANLYDVWPRSSLILNCGEDTHGMAMHEVESVAASAELVLLIGGRVKTPAMLEGGKCRAYVDINPAKTQVYSSQYDVDYGFDQFDFFFTYGLNIGTHRCDLPTGGLQWHGLIPPVYLDHWPTHFESNCKRFTTISTWAGRSTFYWKNKFSGEKSDQWRNFVQLPRKTSQGLEVALKIATEHADDRKVFTGCGWNVVDARELSSLDDYRRYIQKSRGEFSVANNRYVEFQSAWVSDRTARYLASGKPVLVQSTGVEKHIPAGKGFVTFSTMDEALCGLDEINQDYDQHCREARGIAEEHFEAKRIVKRILHVAGLD